MNYSLSFYIAFNELQKAINNDRLNYFKGELLKVLEAKEKHNYDVVSKAIEDYDYLMNKTLKDVYGIEKGRVATIGEVREWKGKKYRKIAPGKWRPIYESETRGAKQSIRILKSKIQNAKSTDELLELVMQNVNRFQGPDGKLLPIVEELKKEVETSKQKLNAGKPTAKEKIEEIKRVKEAEEKPIEEVIDNIPIDTQIEYEKRIIESTGRVPSPPARRFAYFHSKSDMVDFMLHFNPSNNDLFDKLDRLYLEKEFGEKITNENFIDKAYEYAIKYFDIPVRRLNSAKAEAKETHEWPQERLFNEFHKDVQLRDTSNNPVMKCKNFDDLSNLFGKYDIQLTDKLKKLNFEAVQKASTGMFDFMQDFPIPKEYKIPRLDATSHRFIMCVESYKDGTTVQIDFNNKAFSSMENLKEIEKNEFFHAGDGNSNAESFGYHEMAHILDNMLRHYNLSSSEKICKIAYKNIKEKGLKGLSYEASQKTISQYATENVHELFAEAFADIYLYGNNASPLSLEIVKLAKQEYNYLMKEVIKNDN